jgi:hypothetical protein
MAFSETMKELLEQGAQVSKEFAIKAGEKAQDWGGRGLQASKELVNKAGSKAQELGEIGVLKLEVKQLDGQVRKLIGRLGAEVYNAFTSGNAETVSRDDPALKVILMEISSVKEAIEKRETELQNKKG